VPVAVTHTHTLAVDRDGTLRLKTACQPRPPGPQVPPQAAGVQSGSGAKRLGGCTVHTPAGRRPGRPGARPETGMGQPAASVSMPHPGQWQWRGAVGSGSVTASGHGAAGGQRDSDSESRCARSPAASRTAIGAGASRGAPCPGLGTLSASAWRCCTGRSGQPLGLSTSQVQVQVSLIEVRFLNRRRPKSRTMGATRQLGCQLVPVPPESYQHLICHRSNGVHFSVGKKGRLCRGCNLIMRVQFSPRISRAWA
jgi:hypothetical protein